MAEPVVRPGPLSFDTSSPAAIRRAVLRLAWPVVLQQAFRMLIFIVDAIMIGQVGTKAMAAMGVVGPVMFTTISLLMALGVGTIATVSRAVGEGDGAKQEQDAATSLSLALASGIVLSAIGAFVLPLFLLIYNVPGESGVMADSHLYLMLMGATLLFPLLEMSSSSILRAAGDTLTPMLIAILCNGVNILANYVFIFGKFGAPEMGMPGAAIGTMTAFGLQGLLTSAVLFLPKAKLRLRLSSFRRITRDSVRRLVRVTVPAVVEPAILQSGFMVYAWAVIQLGPDALAAHWAAIRIESLSFLPGYGFSIACSAFVGQMLGAKKPEVAEQGMRESARLSTWVMSALAVVFLTLGLPIMTVFSPGDESVAVLGATCLAIIAFAQPPMSLAMVYGGAIRGAGDTRSPAWVGVVGVWGFRVPFAYILTFWMGLGLYGIWITMILDWVARTVVFAIIWRRGRWKSIKL